MKYYQRLLAWRFLWPAQGDQFIKIINGFSFVGITIGVATLIVVMSVMNGFKTELVDKTLSFCFQKCLCFCVSNYNNNK